MTEAPRISRVEYDPNVARSAGRHLFMCRHQSGRERPIAEITASHDLDLIFQEQYGVRWLSYFVERASLRTYCLVEAPSREALEAAHFAAHGQMPSYNVIEVEWDMVRAFLGDIGNPASGQDWASSPFRTVAVIQVANSSELALRHGDRTFHDALAATQALVSRTVAEFHGTVVRTDIDSSIASFTSAARAAACALRIQERIRLQPFVPGFALRIGINAGEPVTDAGELFGATVQLARDVCAMAPPSVILASSVVHDLCQGKGLEFARHSDIEIAGDSVRLYELRSRTPSAPTPRTSFPDGLTHREIEVLRLIAAGKSNQHIAGELVISLNTVARHVANILDKTGSENRTEAAAYAYRERLV